MRRISQKGFVLTIAVLSIGMFFLGLIDSRSGRDPGDVVVDTADYYHEKSSDPVPLNDTCYKSDGCHIMFPHERERRFSSFINFHTIFIDCFVCHMIDGTELLVESVRGKKLLRITVPEGIGDYHKIFGKAQGCRECHSRSGKKRLEARAKDTFDDTFLEPYALKLLEEDSRKWDVPGF